MNDVLTSLARGLLRATVLLMGLVVFLSLLVAASVLALLWGLRVLWARISGRPVAPWAFRVDPRQGWSTVYRRSARWSEAASTRAPGAGSAGRLPSAPADVTDVQARDV